jgi:cyclomaltodextrinase
LARGIAWHCQKKKQNGGVGVKVMWFDDATIYQIYPLGLCGAPLQNDGSDQTGEHRILRVLDWVEHIKKLGATCVLFNPLFDSDAHGYDTRDYNRVDPRLGTKEDFQAVCKALHEAGIRVMLDGVFNHVGRGFWAFRDVQEKKWDSAYKDWFHISFDGNSAYNDGFWYEGWEGHFELVKLNLQNPAVVDYLLDCVKMWIEEFGIDGLRLDVAYCLDHNFMRRLRSFCEELKPGFALIGEVLFGDYNLIVNDEMLHSCTNYECYKGIFSSFNCMNMFEIAHSLNRQFGPEQWCIYRGKHLMTFVDNHDVTRIASILTNKNHLPLAYGLLFGMPGIPCIYYGSEWGEEGVKAPDNDYALRPCFEEPKPNELTNFIKELIEVRRNSDALCNGSYRNVVITNHQLIFERRTDNERVLVAINAGDSEFTAGNGELQGNFTELLANADEIENVTLNGQLTMPAYSVQFLKAV